ncbi:hypothetical protein ACIQXD_37075 [Streptomyces uncialis]|uniref:hypothetical protein n=1 Tax=Streptomyces uncialis TaxID=1048205 RepID=UPI00381BDFB8
MRAAVCEAPALEVPARRGHQPVQGERDSQSACSSGKAVRIGQQQYAELADQPRRLRAVGVELRLLSGVG